MASLTPSCQNFTLGETRRKERDREERLWSYEEDAAIFSKLVPETASEGPELHLPSLPVGSTPTAQCLRGCCAFSQPWRPHPHPSLSYFLVARSQEPQAGQAWCGWEKMASCRAAAGSVFTCCRLMGAGVAIGIHLEICQPEAFKHSLYVLPRTFSV